MPNHIYENVLSRLEVEVPLFAQNVLDDALKQVGATPETVSAFEMKKIIDLYIEPVLKKKMGIERGICELGSGVFSLNEKGVVVYADSCCERLYPEIYEKTFILKSDIIVENISLASRDVKIMVIPIIGEDLLVKGASGVVMDVTLMTKLNLEVVEAYERLEDVLLSTEDWIWEVDKNGIYTFVSRKVEDILGYKVEEILGRSPFDFMEELEAKRVGAMFQKLVSKMEKIIELENWNLAKSGEKVCLLTSGVPVFKDGVFVGYRGVDKDITVRKRLDLELKQKNGELQQFNRFMVDRELTMVDLKQKVADMEKLLEKHGLSVEQNDAQPDDVHQDDAS